MFDKDFELDIKELTTEDLKEFIKAIKSDIERASKISRDNMIPKQIEMSEYVWGESIETHRENSLASLNEKLKEFEQELLTREK